MRKILKYLDSTCFFWTLSLCHCPATSPLSCPHLNPVPGGHGPCQSRYKSPICCIPLSPDWCQLISEGWMWSQSDVKAHWETAEPSVPVTPIPLLTVAAMKNNQQLKCLFHHVCICLCLVLQKSWILATRHSLHQHISWQPQYKM